MPAFMNALAEMFISCEKLCTSCTDDDEDDDVDGDDDDDDHHDDV